MIRSVQMLPKMFREEHGIPLVIDTFLLYFQRKDIEKHRFPLVIDTLLLYFQRRYIENINFRWLEYKRVECDAESPPPIDKDQ